MRVVTDGGFTVSRPISCFNIRQSISFQMGSRRDLIASIHNRKMGFGRASSTVGRDEDTLDLRKRCYE